MFEATGTDKNDKICNPGWLWIKKVIYQTIKFAGKYQKFKTTVLFKPLFRCRDFQNCFFRGKPDKLFAGFFFHPQDNAHIFRLNIT